MCNTLEELEKGVEALNGARGGIPNHDIKVLKEKVDTMARTIANIADLKAEKIKAWHSKYPGNRFDVPHMAISEFSPEYKSLMDYEQSGKKASRYQPNEIDGWIVHGVQGM